jgi:hypothetical protein
MELRSSFFTAHMNDPCKDILPGSMKEMVAELSTNAIFVMNTDIEASVTARVIETIVDQLINSKFKYMPFYLVCEGFSRGSIGELGGTTRFTVRNVYTWMNAMHDKLALINIETKNKQDAERRAAESKDFRQHQKGSNLFAAAMSKKMEWRESGVITTEADYDRYPLFKIVELIKKGYTIKEIQPSMIL